MYGVGCAVEGLPVVHHIDQVVFEQSGLEPIGRHNRLNIVVVQVALILDENAAGVEVRLINKLDDTGDVVVFLFALLLGLVILIPKLGPILHVVGVEALLRVTLGAAERSQVVGGFSKLFGVFGIVIEPFLVIKRLLGG